MNRYSEVLNTGLPANLMPAYALRARREVDTHEAVNSRFVNHWMNDVPNNQQGMHMDMNPTASRLYREDIRQSQPYIIPTDISGVNAKLTDALQSIQWLITQPQTEFVKKQLEHYEELYKLLLKEELMLQMDSTSSNPYFQKYDVASDSRNIVRELRGVVSEDIVDRGVRESQKLLQRDMESRWISAASADRREVSQNPIEAFELMRPKLSDFRKQYRSP